MFWTRRAHLTCLLSYLSSRVSSNINVQDKITSWSFSRTLLDHKKYIQFLMSYDSIEQFVLAQCSSKKPSKHISSSTDYDSVCKCSDKHWPSSSERNVFQQLISQCWPDIGELHYAGLVIDTQHRHSFCCSNWNRGKTNVCSWWLRSLWWVVRLSTQGSIRFPRWGSALPQSSRFPGLISPGDSSFGSLSVQKQI